MKPTLIAVAHGTRSATGQQQIRDLVAAAALRRPDIAMRLAYVDVQQPRIADVVAATKDAVVVPLLLSTGYHVRVDIAGAVAGTGFPVSAPLGPDAVLLDSLRRHLPGDADAVVLAAAGSSDPQWRADIEGTARDLGAHVGYAAGPHPRVADVVADLRAAGRKRIAVAAYLLADGLFYRTLHRAGADTVTPPLCFDPAVADLLLDRFLTTAAARL